MSLTNYRDLSTSPSDVNAGFQFEFYCERCGDANRTPFKPYRTGQVSGWLSRLTFLFGSGVRDAGRASGVFADAGAQSAKAEALAEAQAAAQSRFRFCGHCSKWVGPECWHNGRQSCKVCAETGMAGAGQQAPLTQPTLPGAYIKSAPAAAMAGGMACPQCGTAAQGSRFCPGCGYDTAAVFKSCPACGTTLPRQARFCTDCGHGF